MHLSMNVNKPKIAYSLTTFYLKTQVQIIRNKFHTNFQYFITCIIIIFFAAGLNIFSPQVDVNSVCFFNFYSDSNLLFFDIMKEVRIDPRKICRGHVRKFKKETAIFRRRNSPPPHSRRGGSIYR